MVFNSAIGHYSILIVHPDAQCRDNPCQMIVLRLPSFFCVPAREVEDACDVTGRQISRGKKEGVRAGVRMKTRGRRCRLML